MSTSIASRAAIVLLALFAGGCANTPLRTFMSNVVAGGLIDERKGQYVPLVAIPFIGAAMGAAIVVDGVRNSGEEYDYAGWAKARRALPPMNSAATSEALAAGTRQAP